ncbi:MAG: hypothetical protein EB127_15585 [Alphaproteobacteria bacterium]|nr:hypothetical protein [Alphaproteobacteria bacterium]
MESRSLLAPQPPDIRTVNPADTVQVYIINGHGCVYNTKIGTSKQTTIVPPGIIWIEQTTCGLYKYASQVEEFMDERVKAFLLNTPMPTTDVEKSKYQARLDSLTNHLTAKFPGMEIPNGYNDVHGILKSNRVTKSGIRDVYNPPIEYVIKDSNDPLDEADIVYMYDSSIYPTKEQALDTLKKGGRFQSFKVEFDKWFDTMRTPLAKKHVVLIQGGCRADCTGKEFKDMLPLREISGKRIMNNIARRNLDDLLVKHPDGSTKLLKLLEAGYWKDAVLLIKHLETLRYEHIAEYINTLSHDGRSALDYTLSSKTDDPTMESLLLCKGARNYSPQERVEHMVKLIIRHNDNVNISRAAIEGLYNQLVRDKDSINIDKILETGAMPVLIEFLRKDIVDLYAKIIFIIGKIIFEKQKDSKFLATFISYGSLDILLELFHKGVGRMNILIIIKIIINVPYYHTGYEALISSKGLDILVEFLSKGTGGYDENKLILDIMKKIINFKGFGDQLGFEAFISSKGLDILLELLRKGIGGDNLNKLILDILKEIINFTNYGDQVGFEEFISSKGLDILLELLRKGTGGVNKLIFNFVDYIVREKEDLGADAFIRSGGLAIFLEILRRDDEDDSINKDIIDTLAILTNDMRVEATLYDSDIVPFLTKLLKRGTIDFSNIIILLKAISRYPGGVASILSHGGEELLLMSINNQYNLDLLNSITKNADGVRAILSVKAVDAIISKIVKLSTDDSPLLKYRKKYFIEETIELFNKLRTLPEGELEVVSKLSAALSKPNGKSSLEIVELASAMGIPNNSKPVNGSTNKHGGTRRKRISSRSGYKLKKKIRKTKRNNKKRGGVLGTIL